MRKNLTVRNWIKKKFGKDIPSKCNEAFKDNSLSALPISFRNSYIKDLEFPIPLLLPDSEILEIVTEYNDSAQEALAQAEYNLELGIEDEEDVDCTSIFLYNSVSTSLLNSTKFYPDFDYLSREIIEELKKDESQESWTESMAPHGFMGDWDEVYNLLSPIGLMNAYTWMSSMDITATHQYDSGGGEFKFGELFKASTPEWRVYIPVTIFTRYNDIDEISERLNDYELVNRIIKYSGMSFSYDYKISTSKYDLGGKKSEELADKILDNIFSDEKLFLYLKKWEVGGKNWIKIGITNDPNRRDSEQNVLPVPSKLLKIITMPDRKIAEKIEKELLNVYFDKRINGANNKELFELNGEDIENLMQTMNSLDKKLNS